MPRRQTKFVCRECGYETPRWLGRCPECGNWGSLDETVVVPDMPATTDGQPGRTRGGRLRGEQAGEVLRDALAARGRAGTAPVLPVTELPAEPGIRQPTGLGELDLVLGGGTGSDITIGGDSGISLVDPADIEGAIGEGQLLAPCRRDPVQMGPGGSCPRPLDFGPDHPCAVPCQARSVQPDAAPDVEQPGARDRGPRRHEGQPTVLTGTPDVAGTPALRFVHGAHVEEA